jgi:hypothetical protein
MAVHKGSYPERPMRGAGVWGFPKDAAACAWLHARLDGRGSGGRRFAHDSGLPQLVAKLEKKARRRRAQKRKTSFYRGFSGRCAGAIRSMYHEVSVTVRLRLAA